MKDNRISSSSIINRREIEPLMIKAQEVIRSYEQATNVRVAVLDQTGHTISDWDSTASDFFCKLCRKYYSGPTRIWEEREYPCTAIHINSITEAQRSGGVCIYACNLGFAFWTCPIFSNGRFAGALMAGIAMAERSAVVEKIHTMSGGAIPRESAEKFLADIPSKGPEEIKALAQLLLTCAEHISKGIASYHKTLKRRAEQQEKLSAQIELLKTQYVSEDLVPGYPLDKEQLLLTALRQGDTEQTRTILNELLAALFFSNPDNFKFMQFRAIELVVLLSRSAVISGNTEDALLETNNHYLRCIQEAQSTEELIDILHIAVDYMTGLIFSFQGIRHASALRKAEQYIWENYTRKISLQEVAEASGLSAPYFSTVFKEEMGENLSSYLNRLRVDKAAAMLAETKLSLSEIAGSCGFEDQSWFSKIFKSYTGMSPGKYREQSGEIVTEISEEHLSVKYPSFVKK
jgi:AraC-like DNA-binding protein/ligand-binding sensor protein